MAIKKRKLSGTPQQEPRSYETEHAQLARRAAAEGIVLLKNENGLLPLAKGSKLALFGAGAGRTVKGGTGSGDVNERASVSVFQGLTDAGFEITTKEWIEDYDRRYRQARQDWKEAILTCQKELEQKGGLNAFFEAYSTHQLPCRPVHLSTKPKRMWRYTALPVWLVKTPTALQQREITRSAIRNGNS